MGFARRAERRDYRACRGPVNTLSPSPELSYYTLQLCRHLIDGSHAVDRLERPFITVIRDNRGGLIVIGLEPLAERLGVVVGPVGGFGLGIDVEEDLVRRLAV